MFSAQQQLSSKKTADLKKLQIPLLTPDIWVMIFSMLSPVEIEKYALVCVAFSKVAQSNAVWANKIRQEITEALPPLSSPAESIGEESRGCGFRRPSSLPSPRFACGRSVPSGWCSASCTSSWPIASFASRWPGRAHLFSRIMPFSSITMHTFWRRPFRSP